MSGVGAVTGSDLNDGIIVTARRVALDIDWHMGQAEALPFDDVCFDRTISQFVLMLF
jgi:ubiquinone/menaquinone biosynthesis C-methylase UbiE